MRDLAASPLLVQYFASIRTVFLVLVDTQRVTLRCLVTAYFLPLHLCNVCTIAVNCKSLSVYMSV